MFLVTGATGNVGAAVLDELSSRAVPARVLVRDPSRLGPVAAGVEVVQGDLADEASLERALTGVHAAFLGSPLSPALVDVQARFATIAQRLGVQRIVQLSGAGANPELCCARALRWLGQSENAVARTGIAVTVLRPTFFMQNLLQFAPVVASCGVISGPFRSRKWTTWVDARDVGAVAACVLQDSRHVGETYIVTGSEELSYGDIAGRLSAVLGKPIRYQDITANETRGRLQAAGMAPVMIEATLELWDACAANLINAPPTTVVQEITGRPPRSFEQFANDYKEKFLKGECTEIAD